jgi:3-oxoacyl-[acyl-carrier protein] reductase
MTQIPVVLVTGSGRGLGRGIALCCAKAGFSVSIHYSQNEEAARESVSLCRSVAPNEGQQFIPVRGNISTSADRTRLFEETLSAFGRLDALVNNAGMAPRSRADLIDATESSFDEVMSVNLRGPYFLSQLAARYWLEHRGQGRLSGGYKLIFITSISAETASVNRGEYCISKAGLGMAAQLWAARLAGEGIQVFDIRPGIMETDMTAAVKEKYDKMVASGLIPQMRWGTPEDVGRAVGSILNGDLPYSTGNVIPIDGGFHLRRL